MTNMGFSARSQIVSRAPYIANIKGGKNNMKIIVTSIFVQDQDKALEFYSEKLGFVKKGGRSRRRIQVDNACFPR